MSDETENPPVEPVEDAPKRRGRPPKAATEAAPGATTRVRILRSAVHDGQGGKFYQGHEVDAPAEAAAAWIANGWAELA